MDASVEEIPLRLLEEFRRAYPEAAPPRVCRAPGRVNLIGEHTDYNGLPVLPMAIDRDIDVAFAPREDQLVRLRNGNAEFPPAEFRNTSDIPPSRPGSWDNYCKAAVQGLNGHFAPPNFPGMDVYVSGAIPHAAGLSSSSALVVASALAYLAVLGKNLGDDISRITLASLLADAEQYVGTRGGGMDQAIILLGRPSEATKIDFFPLRTEQASLPADFTVVVCNSLVKAAKTGEALDRYNEGPLTSRLICALVEKHLQREYGPEIQLERLGDLWLGNLCLTHAEAEELLDGVFPAERVTVDEAAAALGVKPPEIRKRWLGDLREPKGGFRLRSRARHQRTEYQRVEAARDALLAGDALELGRLMNASHESCAQDYTVSCGELDRLVEVARTAGAVGARLTGAGFGGCTVNLVPTVRVADFCQHVEKGYYIDFLQKRTADLPRDAIMTVTANNGANYID